MVFFAKLVESVNWKEVGIDFLGCKVTGLMVIFLILWELAKKILTKKALNLLILLNFLFNLKSLYFSIPTSAINCVKSQSHVQEMKIKRFQWMKPCDWDELPIITILHLKSSSNLFIIVFSRWVLSWVLPNGWFSCHIIWISHTMLTLCVGSFLAGNLDI